MTSEGINFFDGWVKKRTLGKGTFGCVTLWRHEISHEAIAIKECCLQLSSRNKQRWREEIDMMTKKQHPNLIAVREIPAGLEKALNSPEPCLGMELGEGGDLRKFLNQSLNSTGLSEFVVLNILRDVANAVSFLHSHKIIHRDLKPENILLTYMGDKVVYKITDLGYAKQLDQSSVANSFVGTMKYLAPELYTSEKDGYTITADYWSFGNVIFECITGHRPFDFDRSFVDWLGIVSKKNTDHICGYPGEGSEIEFRTKLPKPNKLSSPLVSKFEEWLRLVMDWNPRRRGGEKDETGRRLCFRIIDDILDTKTVHVFCVSSCKLLSFAVEESDTVCRLEEKIREHLEVEPDAFVLPNGQTPDASESLLECYNQAGDTEWVLYSLNTEFLLKRSGKRFHGGYSVTDDMATCVQKMMESPDEARTLSQYKRTWACSFDFCSRLAKNYRRLLQAQRAIILTLRSCNSCLMREQEVMIAEANKLNANLDMLLDSCECDLNLFHKTGYGKNCCECDLNLFHKTGYGKNPGKNLINDLKAQVAKVQREFVDLKSSSLVTIAETELDELTKCAKEELEKLTKLIDTQKSDSKYMSQLLWQAISVWERLEYEFYGHLGKVIKCKKKMQMLLPTISDTVGKIQGYRKKLTKMMQRKQEMTWKTLMLESASSSLSSGYNSVTNTLSSLIQDVNKEQLDSTSVVTESKEKLDKLGSLIKTISKYDQQNSLASDALISILVKRRVSANAVHSTLKEDELEELEIVRKPTATSEPAHM
eukprot:gene17037-18752_t